MTNPVAERIAEAGQVLKMYGGDAAQFAAARIGALALEGDVEGVQRWREIAEHLTILMGMRGAH